MPLDFVVRYFYDPLWNSSKIFCVCIVPSNKEQQTKPAFLGVPTAWNLLYPPDDTLAALVQVPQSQLTRFYDRVDSLGIYHLLSFRREFWIGSVRFGALRTSVALHLTNNTVVDQYTPTRNLLDLDGSGEEGEGRLRI